MNQDDSDGEDDYRSVAGSVDERSSTPLRTRTELSSRQMLSEAVEKLSEKRYTTRESGLEQLIKHFRKCLINCSSPLSRVVYLFSDNFSTASDNI